jgi:hypothetical protein
MEIGRTTGFATEDGVALCLQAGEILNAFASPEVGGYHAQIDARPRPDMRGVLQLDIRYVALGSCTPQVDVKECNEALEDAGRYLKQRPSE